MSGLSFLNQEAIHSKAKAKRRLLRAPLTQLLHENARPDPEPERKKSKVPLYSQPMIPDSDDDEEIEVEEEKDDDVEDTIIENEKDESIEQTATTVSSPKHFINLCEEVHGNHPYRQLKFILSEQWSLTLETITFTNNGTSGSYEAIVLTRTKTEEKGKKFHNSINIPIRHAGAFLTAVETIAVETEKKFSLSSVKQLKALMEKEGGMENGFFVTNIENCGGRELPKLEIKFSQHHSLKTETVQWNKQQFDVLTLEREAAATKKPFSLSLPASYLTRLRLCINLFNEVLGNKRNDQ